MLGSFANLKSLQKLLGLFCGSALEVKNLYASRLGMGKNSGETEVADMGTVYLSDSHQSDCK